MLYNTEFPLLLETTYVVDSETQQRMINTVLSQKDNGNYHGGYTFHVKDQCGDFKNLYNYFLKSTESVTGPLTLAPRNKSWCWANVYNRDNFKTNLHDHVATSSINAIYYLKMPVDLKPNEGGLRVFNINNELIEYYPDEFDLIIMPSNIPHEPLYHSSEDFRIAINMEICTLFPISQNYTEDKIYAAAQPRL
jgi:hypothetical protein